MTNLDGGQVSLEPDDLSHELVVPDPDEFVHGRPAHLLCGDDGPGDRVDVAELALALLVPDLGQLLVHGAGHDDVGVDDDEEEETLVHGGPQEIVQTSFPLEILIM